MLNSIKKIIYFLIPVYEYKDKSKKIYKRISYINREIYEFEKDGVKYNNLQYVETLNYKNYDQLYTFYVNSINNKQIFEEKAKAILIAITLAVALATGIMTIFVEKENYFNNWFIVLSILSFLSIFYMFSASILALELLGNKNQVYQLFPSDMELNKKEKIKNLALAIEQNTNLNMIRNNIIYVAYRSIINSTILILIIFIITCYSVLKNNVMNTDEVYRQNVISNMSTFNMNLTKLNNHLNDINESIKKNNLIKKKKN